MAIPLRSRASLGSVGPVSALKVVPVLLSTSAPLAAFGPWVSGGTGMALITLGGPAGFAASNGVQLTTP